MSVRIIRPSNRPEWLEARRQGIGSSEIATIMGVNPWQSPFQLWQDKRGEAEEKKDTAAMRAGRYLEDAVARYFEEETSLAVDPTSAGDWCAYTAERPWERCSPDRLYSVDGAQGILECKTCRRPFDVDDLPRNYYCQLQWQLGIMDIPQGALAWLASGVDFGVAFVDLDRQFFTAMRDKAAKWWERHIIKGEPPEPTTAADVRLIFPTHESKTMAIAGEGEIAAYHRLIEIKEEKKKLEEEQKTLEDKLIFEIGGNEGIAISDNNGGLTPLATYKGQNRTTFNSAQFKADHPDVWAQYAQTSTYRVLRIK